MPIRRRASFFVAKRIAGVAGQRSYLELHIPSNVILEDVEIWARTPQDPGASFFEYRTARFNVAAPAMTAAPEYGIATPLEYLAAAVALPAVGDVQALYGGSQGGSPDANSDGHAYKLGTVHAPGASRYLVIYGQTDNVELWASFSGFVRSWRAA